MRELTLLESSYLAGMILLSLVLPLLMSISAAQDAAAKRSCMRTAWIGQAVLVVAGLAVLASASIAPYATVFGVMGCVCFTLVLLQQFQSIPREGCL
jgi:hypothetical protein